jgi:hypothetical protein
MSTKVDQKVVTWLILLVLVVICLSERLSHVCLSINKSAYWCVLSGQALPVGELTCPSLGVLGNQVLYLEKVRVDLCVIQPAVVWDIDTCILIKIPVIAWHVQPRYGRLTKYRSASCASALGHLELSCYCTGS